MKLEQRIHALLDSDAAATLAGIRRGIEKESLRITTDGTLAQTPHPAALGSALTHPYITTDYSESLLEFIPPPSTALRQPIEFLENLHGYAYRHIDDLNRLVTPPHILLGNHLTAHTDAPPHGQ